MRSIRLIFLSLKSTKFFYFIPLVVLYILIPLSNYSNIKLLGVETSYIVVMNTAQRLIPILSVWWVFCLIREYIESDGNEVLYALRGKKQTNALSILMTTLWYLLHVAVLYTIYSFLYENMAIEYIKIAIQSFFLVSLFYFVVYIFKSTSISFMMILIYYMMTMFFSRETIFEKISIFSIYEACTVELLLDKYLPIFSIGIIFFFLARTTEKRFFA